MSAALLLVFLAIGWVPCALGLKVRASALLLANKIPVVSVPVWQLPDVVQANSCILDMVWGSSLSMWW